MDETDSSVQVGAAAHHQSEPRAGKSWPDVRLASRVLFLSRFFRWVLDRLACHPRCWILHSSDWRRIPASCVASTAYIEAEAESRSLQRQPGLGAAKCSVCTDKMACMGAVDLPCVDTAHLRKLESGSITYSYVCDCGGTVVPRDAEKVRKHFETRAHKTWFAGMIAARSAVPTSAQVAAPRQPVASLGEATACIAMPSSTCTIEDSLVRGPYPYTPPTTVGDVLSPLSRQSVDLDSAQASAMPTAVAAPSGVAAAEAAVASNVTVSSFRQLQSEWISQRCITPAPVSCSCHYSRCSNVLELGVAIVCW
jgi:hypothetical protein